MDINADPSRGRSPLTLAIDIGGTKLKAGLLDRYGAMVAGPNRVETPPKPDPSKGCRCTGRFGDAAWCF